MMLPASLVFVALLQSALIQSENIVEDVSETSKTGFEGWHNQYHKLAEIVEKLKEVNSSFENVNLFSIGKSYENRDMLAIRISGKKKENKPVFFIQCGIHAGAKEWITASNCMYFVDQMSSKYGKDYYVTQMLDKMDFVILPVMNVDGYVYSWINDYTRERTKNRRRLFGGCYGVDLNRNFGYMFWNTYPYPAKSSIEPCKDSYRGYSAFSESETRNVRDYLTSLGGNLKGFIDFHGNGQEWFLPWRYTDQENSDRNEQQRVSIEAVRAIYRAGYRKSYMCCFESGMFLVNRAGGAVEDWVYGQLGVKYTFSVSLRSGGRYAGKHRELPTWMIVRTGKETFQGLKALVKAMKV